MVIQFQGFRSSPSSANLPIPALDVVREVEAKYPALLFKQQLTAYVEKIYGIIRDNLKKEISSFLSLCIQVLLTSFINSVQPNNAVALPTWAGMELGCLFRGTGCDFKKKIFFNDWLVTKSSSAYTKICFM